MSQKTVKPLEPGKVLTQLQYNQLVQILKKIPYNEDPWLFRFERLLGKCKIKDPEKWDGTNEEGYWK